MKLFVLGLDRAAPELLLGDKRLGNFRRLMDDCNHSQFGAFILAGPSVPALGELHGVRLLDIAPTLMEVGGYEIPESFQGRSIFAGSLRDANRHTVSGEAEEIIRQRLSGLGYIG